MCSQIGKVLTKRIKQSNGQKIKESNVKYSSFGGFVFDEGGYFEGGYEGGSFGDE